MDVHIDCQCGEYLLVSEGSAGATITCPCGRPLKVPSLKEFRLRAGLPAYEPSPELIIQHQLLAGELPPDRNCVHCGADTDQVVQVAVECEKAFRTGGFSWGVFLVSLLFLPIKIWHWKEEVQHGEDKVFVLPLALCISCHEALSTREGIKQCLRSVEVYGRLLAKFPNAKVRVKTR